MKLFDAALSAQDKSGCPLSHAWSTETGPWAGDCGLAVRVWFHLPTACQDGGQLVSLHCFPLYLETGDSFSTAECKGRRQSRFQALALTPTCVLRLEKQYHLFFVSRKHTETLCFPPGRSRPRDLRLSLALIPPWSLSRCTLLRTISRPLSLTDPCRVCCRRDSPSAPG